MNREELIELVRRIKCFEGSEEELNVLLEKLEKNVLYPDISDLIFWDEKTPEEIIDIALSYKPIQL